jgi:phosphoribosylanthranilate isomerase
MGLKLKVKVSEVTNLSDARYCAGMGVDMIGFHLDENYPRFIEINTVKEITNWISGVEVVGEFAASNLENVNYLATELKLDYVQLTNSFKPEEFEVVTKPIILKLDLGEVSLSQIEETLILYKPYIAYFLLENNKHDTISDLEIQLATWCKSYPIILGFGLALDQLDKIENNISPKGIALKGGDEIKPGLKNFDELSEILEALELD